MKTKIYLRFRQKCSLDDVFLSSAASFGFSRAGKHFRVEIFLLFRDENILFTDFYSTEDC